MRILSILSICTIMLWSCTGTGTEEQSEEKPTAEVKEVASVASIMVNPNRATIEELAAVAGLNESVATAIVENRPYLNMTAFHELMMAQLPKADFESLYKGVFVPINLNTAAESEFKLVPGVGDKMAHEFEEYRPYTRVEQFRREIGKYVDETEVARYENYVFVPFDLNTASDEQFLSIPGVGEKMLHEFKEYRPYTSMEQFRREIGKYVSKEEVALYERYIQIIE